MVGAMRKIIGNIVVSGLILITACINVHLVAGKIRMEIRSESGISQQVALGRPFVIDVIVDEVHGSVQTPTLKGLDGFDVHLSGVSSTSINGKTNARYSYTVRINKLGTYAVGPAVVHYQQQDLVSDSLQVTVVKDIGIVSPKSKTAPAGTQAAFLRLAIDAESPFVGQKMKCALRFYYQDTSIALQSIGLPEMPGFDVQNISKPYIGQTEIDGISYHYGEWQWDMYPTKAGEFIVPAYHADYDVPLKDNNTLFGGFFMLMGNRVDRKRVYSNAITIKVQPLPYYADPVHAVGSFEAISAEIKPSVIKEGEGMILTIDIEGNGNLYAIPTPQLVMPDTLKYYDSNNSIIMPQHADELPKKRFEFVVHALKSGNCEIPAQPFTYFDIEKNAYITLHTIPVAVSIMPGVLTAKKDIAAHDESNILEKEKRSDTMQINTVGQWYQVDERKPLPWWLFELLLLLSCLYLVYPVLQERIFVFADTSTRFTRKRALKKIRKNIDDCIQKNDDKKLYALFVQLLQYHPGAQDAHSIDMIMRNAGLHDELEQWNIFFERIAQSAYAQSDNKDTQELCRMAQQWLERLEKII